MDLVGLSMESYQKSGSKNRFRNMTDHCWCESWDDDASIGNLNVASQHAPLQTHRGASGYLPPNLNCVHCHARLLLLSRKQIHTMESVPAVLAIFTSCLDDCSIVAATHCILGNACWCGEYSDMDPARLAGYLLRSI